MNELTITIFPISCKKFYNIINITKTVLAYIGIFSMLCIGEGFLLFSQIIMFHTINDYLPHDIVVMIGHIAGLFLTVGTIRVLTVMLELDIRFQWCIKEKP